MFRERTNTRPALALRAKRSSAPLRKHANLAAGYATPVVFDHGSWAARHGSLRRGRFVAVLAIVIVVALFALAGGSVTSAAVASCPPTKPFIGGAPSRSLLSIVGVLRRRATPADTLPSGLRRILSTPPFQRSGSHEKFFAHYIRRGRVVAGTSYYLIPALISGCGRAAARGRQGIIIAAVGRAGTSVGGDVDATRIESGQAYGSAGGPRPQTTVEMLVPDGVAAVTMHYPAGNAGGSNSHHAPAFTTTTRPVGNVIVVTIPRSFDRLMAPMTMTWRAATGKTVKTFSRL